MRYLMFITLIAALCIGRVYPMEQGPGDPNSNQFYDWTTEDEGETDLDENFFSTNSATNNNNILTSQDGDKISDSAIQSNPYLRNKSHKPVLITRNYKGILRPKPWQPFCIFVGIPQDIQNTAEFKKALVKAQDKAHSRKSSKKKS